MTEQEKSEENVEVAGEGVSGDRVDEAALDVSAPQAEASDDAAEATTSGAGTEGLDTPDNTGRAALEAAKTLAEGDASPHAHDGHDHDHGHGHGGHGHGGHGHGAHEHFAHTTPMPLLLGVLGALVLLTVMTVAVTSIDLGSQGNFVVAMIIATIKAALVMGYFMHLVWDSKFNVVAFLSSFLFVLLFLSMALLDRQEYQPGINQFESKAREAATK